MRGVIPPNGKAAINVSFLPGLYGTFGCEIQVNVSQFNFVPFACAITGSSSPGMHRSRQLDMSAKQLTSDYGPGLGAPMAISSALGHTYGTVKFNEVRRGVVCSFFFFFFCGELERTTHIGKRSSPLLPLRPPHVVCGSCLDESA